MRDLSKRDKDNGQVLAIVMVLLVIMMTLVPAMVLYVQHESGWTAKEGETVRAFHSAEAGIEKGYLELSLSTQTWVTLMKGGSNAPIANFKFDTEFGDVGTGGTYKISITSGPQSQQATVYSVGRDNLRKQIRSIKAVYANVPMGSNAIYAVGGADVNGSMVVEWGSIMSPGTITPPNAKYPQLWSAGSIVGIKTDPTPPNCDSPNCCWWHAYQANLPPAPVVDLNYYKSAAKAAKASTYGCPTGAAAGDCTSGIANDCCYYASDPNTFGGSNILGGATIYVNGSLNIPSAGGGAYFAGAEIIMGNLTTSSGKFGSGSPTMTMPSTAWQQYCDATAWTHYTGTFDSNAPASFPGMNSGYTPVGCDTNGNCPCAPASACVGSKIYSNGLLYMTGYMLQGGGGGGTEFYGVMYVLQTTTMTPAGSNAVFYYNQTAATNMQVTQVILTRVSWQEQVFSAFP